MGVSLDQYKRARGSFNCFKDRLLSGTNCMGTCLILMILVNIGAAVALLLMLPNDVEFNPGPNIYKTF